MKITITKKDWDKKTSYMDPCGCLLACAISRQVKGASPIVFNPGAVKILRKKRYRTFRYSSRIEKQLEAAHWDADLLPMTITLR